MYGFVDILLVLQLNFLEKMVVQNVFQNGRKSVVDYAKKI